MLEILDGGFLTTVQDGGRSGWGRAGVPPSSRMDSAALRAANLLVGNDPTAAGLEVTLTGPALRVILGPQDDHFTPEGLDAFLSSEYEVTPACDRMGYRLAGACVAHRERAEFLSDGVVTGSIQVLRDGQPIVMMVDHQTTGGYPKIGAVIRADLPLLAQCLPGDRVRFRATSVAAAQAAWRALLATPPEVSGARLLHWPIWSP
jgi:allophanate hydrolase subunit 2